METWETFTMSRKEVPRAGLIKAALAGRITNVQGALGVGLSVRQFQRLKVRFQAEGTQGLVHKSRGRRSARRLPPDRYRASLAKSDLMNKCREHCRTPNRPQDGADQERPAVTAGLGRCPSRTEFLEFQFQDTPAFAENPTRFTTS